MPLRILHLSTRLILGGSQENTVLSCEGQSRLGHDVHLAFGPIYGPEGSMLDRVHAFNAHAAQPICTHKIPDLIREVQPLRDRRGLRQLRNLISKIEPDIVHTHSSKAGILGRFAAHQCLRKGMRLGIVHTIHGPPFMPIEGPPMRRLKTRTLNHLYTVAERAAAQRCHLIVSVADAMTSLFLARRIGTPQQYTTIRSGIELEPYLNPAPNQTRDAMRQNLGLAPHHFVIGTVARLAEHKGHDDILTALATLLRQRPHWRLLWVGDGWWKERLLARARDLAIDSSLITTGLVPASDIPGLMRAMDILCHPSSREGLPRTVPQALLAGTCPVAYDVDGTGEVCRDMHTGRLIPHADLDALRDAVVMLADNAELRARLAATGQAECLESFSAHRMVQQLEEVYTRALSMAR